MDSNKDQFKKFMQEESGEVPSNLDWDNMKEGILEKMQSLRTEELPTKETETKRRIGFWVFLFSALLLSIILIPQTMKQDELKDSRKDNAEQEQERQLSLNLKTESVKQVSSSENGESKRSTGNKALELAPELPPSTNQETYKNTEKKSYKGADGNPNLFEEKSVSPGGTEIAIAMPEAEEPGEAALSHSSGTTESAPPSQMDIKNLEILPSRYIQSLPILTSHRLPGRMSQGNIPQAAMNSAGKRIYLDGGVSFWDVGYAHEAPDRASFESPLVSYHFQASYVHPLKNNFFLMAGLNYQQLESVFDYKTTIDDFSITLNDTIIGVENNILTGEQNVVRGDVELSVQADHRVKHYNTTRLLQLPLAMGKIWQKNRFQTDLFLGTAVNLSTHSEGRTLYKDQVVNYEGASNAIISNQWSLHALLGSRLTYYINDHVGISTGFQCQKSLTNWSNEENVSMRPMIINWHVGTNYKF